MTSSNGGMMGKKTLDITDEEQEEASRRIGNFTAFIVEVLENPSILECIPNGSRVEAIPIDQREPDRRYDIETPNMVATVTPGREADATR